MNELTAYVQQLPDTIEDLSKFVLLGREKINCVRAQIRAIDKLQLAEEVRNQKRDEARMLSEAVLDAEVRLGDLLKQIPKATTVKGNQYSDKWKNDSAVDNPRPKHQVISELGISQKQAERFETLADNKDLVEQVKQEAVENDDLPTRSRVIDLAQQRKKKEAEEQEKEDSYYAYLDECKKTADKFTRAIYAFLHVDASQKSLKMWDELLVEVSIPSYLSEIEDSISKLLAIQKFLKERSK